MLPQVFTLAHLLICPGGPGTCYGQIASTADEAACIAFIQKKADELGVGVIGECYTKGTARPYRILALDGPLPDQPVYFIIPTAKACADFTFQQGPVFRLCR